MEGQRFLHVAGQYLVLEFIERLAGGGANTSFNGVAAYFQLTGQIKKTSGRSQFEPLLDAHVYARSGVAQSSPPVTRPAKIRFSIRP